MDLMLKYPSLVTENNQFVLQQLLDKEGYAELYPSEKLDGCNISIIYDSITDTIRVASRNLIVDDNWKGIRSVLGDDYPLIVEELKHQTVLREQPYSVLYGEIYGHGIMSNRCEYTGGTQIVFYSVFTGEILPNPESDGETAHGFGVGWVTYLPLLAGLMPTVDKYVHGENRKVRFHSVQEFATYPNPYPDREGTVWHVRMAWIDTRKSSPIIGFKMRNQQFLEVTSVKQARKITPTHEQHALHAEVEAMVTPNRLHNVMSGLDVPLDKSSIGLYIKSVNEDIVKEFERNHPDVKDNTPKDVYKRLLNVNTLVSSLIKDMVFVHNKEGV